MKTGFVSITGRPNVGKSTQLNTILKQKIAITSKVSGTTRNVIQGIYTDDDSQIVFVDTPGIHKPNNKLGNHMNNKAYTAIDDVDVILFLVDATQEFGRGDTFVLERIKKSNKPVFLVINKVDICDKVKLIELIDKYKDLHHFAEIIPVSATKKDNVKVLVSLIKKYLTDNVKYFADEEITTVSRNFLIAETVREKLLRLTSLEIPHTITCVTELYEENEKYIDISVLVVIDRENIKKMIIGKNGSMLKKVGTYAREDIEKMLGKKVNLKTFVKVIKNWRDKERYLRELGLNDLYF